MNGGENELVLTPRDYVSVDQDNGCQLSFMTIGIPDDFGPMIVLGEPFLAKYYAIFDRKNMQIGFAPFKEIAEKEEDEKSEGDKTEDEEAPTKEEKEEL